MSRYIDAENAISVLEILADKCADDKAFVQSISVLKDVPTEDVVEVVRCKDCKYREGSACDYSAVYVRPNGYCQWGEKDE